MNVRSATLLNAIPSPAPAPDNGTTDTRAAELETLLAQSAALWSRVFAGEDSDYLRARVARSEALLSALVMGDASLVAACHCGIRAAA